MSEETTVAPPKTTLHNVVLDSSKLETFKECPRKFYYSHVLGWRQDSPNGNDLHFGTALHEALEYMLLYGATQANVEPAFILFMKKYREKYAVETDPLFTRKNPASALTALQQYADTYGREKFKVHFTEVAGAVPIGENADGSTREIFFRLDSVLEDERGSISTMDHKTGSRNDRAWRDQWNLRNQLFTYVHVLYTIYEGDHSRIYGAVINGILFKDKSVELVRVPVRKTPDMMEAWLGEVNSWVDFLEHHLLLLREEMETGHKPTMQSFPKNDTACTKYYGCQFMPFCTVWANPLKRSDAPPIGFVQEFWDPRKEHAKNVTKIGVNGELLIEKNETKEETK